MKVFISFSYQQTLSWCQIVVRISRNWEIAYSDRTHTYTAFQEAFQEDLKYSDFFRDQASQRIGDVRREFIFYGLEWDLKRQF